jgi:leader peptidase (prepilin peptidase) / N-methyltransferase
VTASGFDLSPVLASPLFEGAAFAFGLIVGSFANVCIYRLPLGQSVIHPPSRCPACGALIGAVDNVPVLAWLWLRGRCRACRAPISIRYPAGELANGLLYAALAASFGPTPQTVVKMALATALLVLGLIDLDHQLLPDVITLPGIAVGLLATLVPGTALTWWESALATAGGFAVMAAVGNAAKWYYGEEALGMGDWKMTAMLGAFFGWQGMLLALFLGTLAGAAIGLLLVGLGRGSRRTKIPLGTFLALGGLVTLFAGQPLLGWYRGLLRV